MSKASDNKYYLNIHHRSTALNVNQVSGAIEQSFSPGHFFVSLQKNETKQFFGKYAQGKSLFQQLFSKEVIDSKGEELRVIELEKLKTQTGEEYHSYKSIILSKEQYELALDYTRSKIDGSVEPGNYLLAVDDCTDFVQEVYNQAGLPLYFTTIFTRNELMTLGSAASLAVLQKYGASDCLELTMSSIRALNKKTLVKSLNIDIEKIQQNSPDLDLDAPVLVLPSFKVLFDQIKLPQVLNVEQQSSIHNNAASSNINLDNITCLLPIAEKQKEQALSDINGFFAGIMNNPYAVPAPDFAKAFMPSKEMEATAQVHMQDFFSGMMNNPSFQPGYSFMAPTPPNSPPDECKEQGWIEGINNAQMMRMLGLGNVSVAQDSYRAFGEQFANASVQAMGEVFGPSFLNQPSNSIDDPD